MTQIHQTCQIQDAIPFNSGRILLILRMKLRLGLPRALPVMQDAEHNCNIFHPESRRPIGARDSLGATESVFDLYTESTLAVSMHS